MFPPDQYELLDFGHGRRLERFGQLVLDRPYLAVEQEAIADAHAWANADARFVRPTDGEAYWMPGATGGFPSGAGPHSSLLPEGEGTEGGESELPNCWTIAWRELVLELKRTPAGQVGVFPEQASNWDWLQRHGGGCRLLNLFAYTGGSTLTAAAAGAEVTHVDAAGNIVTWARRNADLSGLADAPIRWITEDAVKFVKRELKRGSRYDGVILDPPSYGHGRRGEVWRLSKHLKRLLTMCAELTANHRRLMLLTCHTPGYEAPRLKTMLAEALEEPPCNVGAAELTIPSRDGRAMPSGAAAWWSGRAGRSGQSHFRGERA